uniref:Odorant binding protein 12 n=1 Tax=Xylotrechus quadripes TaxID=554073 RepID=A0A346HGN4_9CUCU|nr:odorant binding protein 12 [Xylotrechus quadripes]
MKSVIVFLCAIVGILAQNRLIVEEQMLHHIHDACQANPATYADHDLLHDLSANLDNPQVGAHMLCESKGVGLQKENGQLDPDTIRDKISLTIGDAAQVDRLVKECAIPKNTPEKTAIHLFMCLDRNGVTYFHEF